MPTTPAPKPWTEAENRLIIADYLAMMAALTRGEKVNKAATRRALVPQLNGRSEGSIEFKRMNISACLVALKQPYLAGYKPMDNYQLSFLEMVRQMSDARA
jgi:hypothetical protein